jgi:hypothetical protein
MAHNRSSIKQPARAAAAARRAARAAAWRLRWHRDDKHVAALGCKWLPWPAHGPQ